MLVGFVNRFFYFSGFFASGICLAIQNAELCQRYAVHIAVDGIVQPRPKIQRVALAAARAVRPRAQAGDGGQLALHGAQDFTGGDILGRAQQAVAALCAAHAAQKPGFAQRRDDLLQIFQADALGIADLLSRYKVLGVVGKLHHQAQGVAVAGRKFHSGSISYFGNTIIIPYL